MKLSTITLRLCSRATSNPVAHLLRRAQVDRDAAAVVGVERLDHHRVPDPLRRRHRVVRGLHQPLAGDRKAEMGEEPVGLFLVGGQLDGDVRGAAGDGGLDPLLVSAVAELDQALVVEADPGNPPLLGGAHERHRAGAERPPLGKADELVALAGEIEIDGHGAGGPEIRRQEREEQGEAEPAGLEAHVFLLVLVDDVVVAGHVGRSGLAEGDRLAGHVLELDGDVLQDVAHPGALTLGEPADEAARLAVGAAVLVEAGQRRDQRIGERGAELAGGPFFERAEVDPEPDDGKMRVEARADVHGLINDSHSNSVT